jgi:hypothetical protein
MVYGADDVVMPEAMKAQFERLIENAKAGILKAADEALSAIYVDIGPFIESDTCNNYRNELRSALERRFWQKKPGTCEELWAVNVRERLFTEHREELEKGLIADLTKERDQYKAWYQELLNSRSR